MTARIAIRDRKPAPVIRELEPAARVTGSRGRRQIEIAGEFCDGDAVRRRRVEP